MSPHFRAAERADLGTLIDLLADDPLGRARESRAADALPAYEAAFDAIESDPNHLLLVATDAEGVVGMAQLSFIPGLTYEGRWRAQIEGVRVARSARGRGLGRALVEHAIDRARERGCVLVQLTSDLTRERALRFYEGLGFRHTHAGFKLRLDEPLG